MGKNVKISEYTGRFVNPTVQLNTSVTQVMNESIDLPTTDQMLFTSDEVEGFKPLSDIEPFRIFKVDDPLTYRTFDPKAQFFAKEKAAVESQSSDNAAAINPLLNN